jgi:hypothetical protein
MATGTTLPVRAKWLATSRRANKSRLERRSALLRSQPADLVTIEVDSETIESTPRHPFCVVEGADLSSRPRPEHVPRDPENARQSCRWVDAGELRVGDELLQKSGRLSPVTLLTIRRVRQKVYNFHVRELSSYAVAGCQILVHNNSGLIGPVKFGSNFLTKVRKHIQQMRWRGPVKDPIPPPGKGGAERAHEIIPERVSQGGGIETTYPGEPAIKFVDGGIT